MRLALKPVGPLLTESRRSTYALHKIFSKLELLAILHASVYRHF
jgi:hypothetical protein